MSSIQVCVVDLSRMEEMLPALGVALLCVNPSPEERPTMKDMATMLKEIKHEREGYAKVDALLNGSLTNNCQAKPDLCTYNESKLDFCTCNESKPDFLYHILRFLLPEASCKN